MAEQQEISLEELKKQVAREQKASEDAGRRVQLIVFKLGDEAYALPIDQVKEVVLTPGIAKVPQTPPFIKGVSNIRGNLIAIVDLEEKFNLSNDNPETGRANYTLVIESEDIKIGVLVKEVPNTLTVSTNNIESSSGVMQYSALEENTVKGIVKTDDRMVILIDIIRMMETDEMKKLANI